MSANSRSTMRCRRGVAAAARGIADATISAAVLSASASLSSFAYASGGAELLPNGQSITPAEARGAVFSPLNPHLPDNPGYVVGQAVTTTTCGVLAA